MDQAHPVDPANPAAWVAVYGWVARQPYEKFLTAIGILLATQDRMLAWYSDALNETWSYPDVP